MAALREIAAHFGVTFDDKALKSGGEAITEGIEKIKGFAESLGAGLALGALWHFTEGLLEEADALSKHSAVLGISMKSLQEWQYMASLAGVSNEALQATFTKLSGGKGAKGLAALKIDAKKLNGELKTGPDLLEDVAEAIAKIENPSERNAKAMAVLGKNYAKLMPLLADGKEGIQKLKDEFEDFGGGWGEETGKDAEEFNDNLTRVQFIWKSFTIGLVSQVLPALVRLSKNLIAIVKPLVHILRNSKMVHAVFTMLAVKGVMFLSNKIGGLGNALKLLTRQFFTVLLPLLLIDDALTFLAGGDSMIGAMLEKSFGAGSAKIVRDFFTNIDEHSKMSLDPKGTLGGRLFSTGLLITDVFKTASIDGDNFYRVIDGVAQGITLAFEIACLEIKNNFTSTWAHIQDGARGVVTTIHKALTGEGAKEELEAKLAGKAKPDFYRGTNENSKKNDTDPALLAARAKFLVTYDRLEKQLDPKTHTKEAVAATAEAVARTSGSGTRYGANGAVITNNTTVNVTVPHGTPAQQANALGKAAAAGAQPNMKATKAALVPGG